MNLRDMTRGQLGAARDRLEAIEYTGVETKEWLERVTWMPLVRGEIEMRWDHWITRQLGA